MNKLVVAILACVAGAAFGDYLIRDSSGVMINVPKNGGYLIEVDPNITSKYLSDDSMGAHFLDFDEIEYTVYFYYAHQGRTIKTELFIDDVFVDNHTFGSQEIQTVSYNLTKGKPITSASSFVFTVYGECTTCISSITIIFWARFKKNNQYVNDYSESNPLPLYFKGYSPMFDINKGESKYFVYESESKTNHIVYKHNDLSGKIVLHINEDDSEYKYKMDDIIDNITFKKGANTIRAAAGKDQDKTYIEIGAFEEASSTIKAMSFVALCILGALLF